MAIKKQRVCVTKRRKFETGPFQNFLVYLGIVKEPWSSGLGRPKVVGSNPSDTYWMDMTFFTLICFKNCIVCLKRPKINKKEAGVGPFF